MPFTGKHVVVTGGTGALGSAVVDALLKAGATCTVPCRNDRDAETFAHRAHVAMVRTGDLADEAAVQALYAKVKPLWASIHIAGGFSSGTVADTDKAALMAQIDGNLVSCFLCCRAALGAMQGGGRIVNVASRQALEPRSGAGMSAYTIAKAGVATLTATLAEEVVRDGVLVNAVAPSTMDTPANRKAMPKADFSAWPKVEEVAATILFLASPENTVTRGAIVSAFGKA